MLLVRTNRTPLTIIVKVSSDRVSPKTSPLTKEDARAAALTQRALQGSYDDGNLDYLANER